MKTTAAALVVLLALSAPLGAFPCADEAVGDAPEPAAVYLTATEFETLVRRATRDALKAEREYVPEPEPKVRRWPTRATRRLIPCKDEERVRARRWIVRVGRAVTPRPRTCKPRRDP